MYVKDRERAIVAKTTTELLVGESMVPCKTSYAGPSKYPTWYSYCAAEYVYKHELVADAFLGPRPAGCHIHHKDENKNNYSPENLEYVDASEHLSKHSKENYRRQDHTFRIERLRIGQSHKSIDGEDNPNAKLSDNDVRKMRRLFSNGSTINELIGKFGVCGTHIKDIVYNRKRLLLENHKLVKKEYLGPQPMYSITVEPDHNYVLSCGVVTYNSQNELRHLAELSGDPLLIKQFNSGIDIHCLVGNKLTGWPIEKIRDDEEIRRLIKNFHFSIVNGVSKEGLLTYMISKGVKTTKEKCDELYDKYFAEYKGVKRYCDKHRVIGESGDVVETLFGFKHRISFGHKEGRSPGNQAINMPIQGSAHQMILLALALLDIEPMHYCYLDEPIMEIHDALNFVCEFRHLQEAYEQGKALMEHSVVTYSLKHFNLKFRIPFEVDAKVGFCLGSLIKYKGEPMDVVLDKWRAYHKKVDVEALQKLIPATV